MQVKLGPPPRRFPARPEVAPTPDAATASVRRAWYYRQGGQTVGPVTPESLVFALQQGALDLETRVWSAGMQLWVPACEIHSLLDEVPPPALPLSPVGVEFEREPVPQLVPRPRRRRRVTPPAPERESSAEELLVRSPEAAPRPWSRLAARFLDYGLLLALLLGLRLAVPSLSTPLSHWALSLGAIAFWVLPETLFLWRAGTTPGRWFLGLRVRRTSGELPSFSGALLRSLGVWAQGMLFGVPILGAFPKAAAHDRLRRRGRTRWDERGGLWTLAGRGWSLRKAAGLILLFVLLALHFYERAHTLLGLG